MALTTKQKWGWAVGLFILVAYFAAFGLMFRSKAITPKSVDSQPTGGAINRVYGNGSLRSLVLLETGKAEVVDAAESLRITAVPIPPNAGEFISGALSPSGNAYLLDDRKQLTRFDPAGRIELSRPIRVRGQALGVAVEERAKVLWCAAIRDKPANGSIFVNAISLVDGENLGSANIGPQGTHVDFFTSADGSGVVMVTDRSPGAFLFSLRDRLIQSHPLRSEERVLDAVFDGPNPVLGLGSGAVDLFNAKSGKKALSFDLGYRPITAMCLRDGQIGIGHGDPRHIVAGGSFQIVDLRNGRTLAERETRSMVTSIASMGGYGFIFGLESGQFGCHRNQSGFTMVQVPETAAPGFIHFTAFQSSICLVIGADLIQRIVI